MASFGENLRRERELRGIGLRDIAEATKISVRFLQALEQDKLDVLPGGIFRRAFVRQYARFVGLDAERLVAEFVYAHGDESQEPAPRSSTPARRRWTPPWGPLVGGVVLLVGGVLAFRPADRPSPARESAPTPVVVAHPEDRVYPPPASPGEAPKALPALSAVTDGLTLTLSAHQSCWVAAEVDGQTVLNRTLSPGETETIEAHGQIVLSVGNAGGLSFRVNDKTGMPLGRDGEVRRNIVITHKSLPSLVEDAAPTRVSTSG
jgi:cytoskeleton protein RodZ